MKESKTVYLTTFLLMILFCASCASGTRLNTAGAPELDTSVAYRVILFGCNYLNDLETTVFFDKEDDQYIFEPSAPDFRYSTENKVTTEDALEKAKRFLNCNSSFSNIRTRAIMTPEGNIIGYEVRPLYMHFTYGVDDVLETNYWLKGDKVVITVRLLPYIEKMFFENGRDREL